MSVAALPWLGHLAVDRGIRSKTSVCLTVEGADADFIKKFAGLLDAEGAAHDIAGYRDAPPGLRIWRSEEHTSELQSLMRISYAVFCLKKTIHTSAHHCPTNHQEHQKTQY